MLVAHPARPWPARRFVNEQLVTAIAAVLLLAACSGTRTEHLSVAKPTRSSRHLVARRIQQVFTSFGSPTHRGVQSLLEGPCSRPQVAGHWTNAIDPDLNTEV
jgi:hypothetical protein